MSRLGKIYIFVTMNVATLEAYGAAGGPSIGADMVCCTHVGASERRAPLRIDGSSPLIRRHSRSRRRKFFDLVRVG